MTSYVQQIEPMGDEEERRRAAEDLAARIGAEGGMRGGTFINLAGTTQPDEAGTDLSILSYRL